MTTTRLLTIAIPTYNRSECVRRCLAAIAPQLDASVGIVVLDNASTDDTQLTLRDFEHSVIAGQLTYIRHPANLGACANLLRAFDVADSDWLWVLGDDDTALPSALPALLREIRQHSDAACISLRSVDGGTPRPRSETFVTQGLAGFISDMDYFCDVLLMSTNVYRLSAIRPYLPAGYFSTHSFAPHVAMLLAYLRAHDDGTVVFSKEHLVNWHRAETGKSWDYTAVSRGMLELLRFAPTTTTKRKLHQQIATVFARVPYFPSLRQTIRTLAHGREAASNQLELFGFLASQLPEYLFGLFTSLMLSFLCFLSGGFLPAILKAFVSRITGRSDTQPHKSAFESAISNDRN